MKKFLALVLAMLMMASLSVAAMADAHFVIKKSVEEMDTTTNIYELNEKSSIEELARILGGAKITETVMQSALEMKELARQTK